MAAAPTPVLPRTVPAAPDPGPANPPAPSFHAALTPPQAATPDPRAARTRPPPRRPEASVAPDTPAVTPPVPAEPLGSHRTHVERDLRLLGYGTPDPRPMSDRAFRDAVRAYQRQIGAEPTGALTYEQTERLRRARSLLAEPRVTTGQMMLVSGDTQVIASGTWSMLAGQPEHPVNRSYISCSRQQATCVESVARLALSDTGSGATLSSELVSYRVIAWNMREVVAELSLRCTTRVLTIRLLSQDIVLTDRPHPTPACRTDTEISAGIQLLRHGAEPLARFYDERRSGAAADASPDLRASTSEAMPTATIAGWR
ncbi:hypothetical protein GXW75_14120 [Roseomonas oryzicola]|uniref:Uncharacterized protein n=1 Tax=Neoroseomonas oryzicola TaxID=535904 RepID=A0A9X9WJ83_9PROT|nr:hypothetical protein [Neoroseomonas oryzicola]